ncbi:phage holin [Domibacillus aminovorans]|uniref:phage holin n=1 Tax=Domibacillus aminovorans TaxID=29332 RepID=UPI0009EE9E72|nr:phage holin [Domibacillus aminovorans]
MQGIKNIDNGTIVRTVVLFVAFLNQFLVLVGYSPLPYESEEEEIEHFVVGVLTFVAAVWAW